MRVMRDLVGATPFSYDIPTPTYDFQDYLTSKHSNFSGRHWITERILQWWRDRAGTPCLLVRAEHGMGKTSLMAELVNISTKDTMSDWYGAICAVHCCRENHLGTLRPSKFVHNLAASLCRSLPKYRDLLCNNTGALAALAVCDADPHTAFEDGIVALLRRVGGPGVNTKVIVVDGLDEAVELARFIHHMVPLLPTWVRMVVTASPEAPRLKLGSMVEMVEIDPHSAENRADVQKYILLRLLGKEASEEMASAPPEDDPFVSILLQKGRGNFLVVEHLIDCVETELSSAPDDMEVEDVLRGLPDHQDGVYKRVFEWLFPDDESFEQVKRLLEVMAASKEPLTAAQLAEVCAVGANDIDDVLGALLVRGTIRTETQRTQWCYSFNDKWMAKWLTSQERINTAHRENTPLFYIDVTNGHQRIAECGLAAYHARGARRLSPYYVRHLLRHLYDSGDPELMEQSLDVAFDFAWLERKVMNYGMPEVLEDFQLLPKDEDAVAVRAVLRHAALIVTVDPTELASQLLGRFSTTDGGAGLRLLLDGAAEAKAYTWIRPRVATLANRFGTQVLSLGGHAHAVESVCVVGDAGRTAVSCSTDGSLIAWDVSTGEELHSLEGHTAGVYGVTALDSRVVSVSADCSVRVWNVDAACEERVLAGHSDEVRAVFVSEALVASGGADGVLRVWDVASGMTLHTVEHVHSDVVTGVALVEANTYIVSVSATPLVQVHELATGRQVVSVPRAHDGAITALAVHEASHKMATSSEDHSVKVWDVRTGELLQTLHHAGAVHACAFTADGQRVVSVSQDKTVRVWDVLAGGQVTWLHFDTVPTCVTVDANDTMAVGDAQGALHFLTLLDKDRTPHVHPPPYENGVGVGEHGSYATSGSYPVSGSSYGSSTALSHCGSASVGSDHSSYHSTASSLTGAVGSAPSLHAAVLARQGSDVSLGTGNMRQMLVSQASMESLGSLSHVSGASFASAASHQSRGSESGGSSGSGPLPSVGVLEGWEDCVRKPAPEDVFSGSPGSDVAAASVAAVPPHSKGKSMMPPAGAPAASKALRAVPSVSVHGWITKAFGMIKLWKRRYFVLDEAAGTLSYFSDNLMTERVRSIPLHTISRVRESTFSKPWPFELCSDGRTYLLSVDSAAERDVWMVQIEQAANAARARVRAS